MDQNDYYTISNDFQQFLQDNNLNIIDDVDKNTNSNINNTERIMNEHIQKLHTIILHEISKKGIKNNFLLKLKKEINNYHLTQ